MTWKAIGESVAGTSHIAIDKGCDDAVRYVIADDVLIACVSDGAGSAIYGAAAATYCIDTMIRLLSVTGNWTEADIYKAVEDVYSGLQALAVEHGTELNEWSCTLLGCCINAYGAIYFQVGDGAIVAGSAPGQYHHIWWPHNGEYQNVTAFVVDDPSLSNLKIKVVDIIPAEVAIFTDGLQMLALNYEQQLPHQPFFNGLFPSLRMADTPERRSILAQKLASYLDSKPINDRTDDDKSLFLATRL